MPNKLLSWCAIVVAVMLSAACSTPPALPAHAELVAQVRAAEVAFAKTMADRNLAAFASFIADDAVFINSGKPLLGKAQIVAHWKQFFDAPAAPFAWRPEIVEVATVGDLGYTEGPVTLPNGQVWAKFYSTWRRGAAGPWQVVFDNGYRVNESGK